MRTLWTDKFASLRQQTKHRADIKPQVGMGVTQHVGSDSNPWEIIEVIDDKHIVVRELDSVATAGVPTFKRNEPRWTRTANRSATSTARSMNSS